MKVAHVKTIDGTEIRLEMDEIQWGIFGKFLTGDWADYMYAPFGSEEEIWLQRRNIISVRFREVAE